MEFLPSTTSTGTASACSCKKAKSMDLFGGASVAFAAMVARTVCTHVKHVVFGSVRQVAVSVGTG